MFRFLRSLQIFFQSGSTSLHSHQQCTRVPFSPHHIVTNTCCLVVFLIMALLTGVRWNLSMLLICISFMTRDGEYFFICFLAIWISSFKKVLFSSVAHFLIGSLILGEFSYLPYYWWMDQENVLVYNGILLSHEEEWNLIIRK
jgi:hypothetical protein